MGFFTRLGLAFKILFDAAVAKRVLALTDGPAEAPAAPEPAKPERGADALQLLAALQREGRFIDVVQEDLSAVDDAEVGATVRLQHAGWKKVVDAWFDLKPAWDGEEGAATILSKDYDRSRVLLSGNIAGDPPFHGTLVHHGWMASRVQVPTLTSGANPKVVAPAEVEL